MLSERKRGAQVCSVCGYSGHNSVTCEERRHDPTTETRLKVLGEAVLAEVMGRDKKMRMTNYFKAIDDVGCVFFPFCDETIEEAWNAVQDHKRAMEGGVRRDANGELIRPTRIVVWRPIAGARWAHVPVIGE